MPRPRKCRRVCCLPTTGRFGPLETAGDKPHEITMTVDEYEAIRLIDYEGLTQEQCAEQMAVGRTTAQAVYNAARYKLAQCLVEGGALRITGGDYALCGECEGAEEEKDCRGCRHGCCRKRRDGRGQGLARPE